MVKRQQQQILSVLWSNFKSEEVKAFLKRNKLDVYIDNFENVGYDDMGQLMSMKTDELMSVATELDIEKPGHRQRFISAIEILKSSAASLGQKSSSTSLESKNSGNDKVTSRTKKT